MVVLSFSLTILYDGQFLVIDDQENPSVTVDYPLQQNLWHHVALVYDQMSTNLTVHINGRVTWQQAWPQLNKGLNFPFLYLGAAYAGIDFILEFTGTLACFKIYDTVLMGRNIDRVRHTCHHVELGNSCYFLMF